MDNFESREARVNYSEDVIYRFVTDIRNFERFVPGDMVKNWQATKDSCSFEVPYACKTGFSITQKEPYSEVNYAGRGMNTDFIIKIRVLEKAENKTIVKVIVQAQLNPMIKMIVAKPLEQFLEKMISEMEIFDGWEKIIE
jgi:carbon monoxide dehydrogenase subunit G